MEGSHLIIVTSLYDRSRPYTAYRIKTFWSTFFVISLSRERGLLWLRYEPLQIFAIIGPPLLNQLIPSTRSTLLTLLSQVPLFVLSRLFSSLCRPGSDFSVPIRPHLVQM